MSSNAGIAEDPRVVSVTTATRRSTKAAWPQAHRVTQAEPSMSHWYDLALYMAPR